MSRGVQRDRNQVVVVCRENHVTATRYLLFHGDHKASGWSGRVLAALRSSP